MVTSFDYDSGYEPSAPVIQLQLRAKHEATIWALLDTGADGTLLPLNILEQIGARYAETRYMRGVTGRAEPVNLYTVNVAIGSIFTGRIHAVAIPEGGEPLVGRDLLNHLVITLHGLAGVTEIAD